MKQMKLNYISNEYHNHVEGRRRKERKGKKQGREGRREIFKIWFLCPDQLE